MREYQSNSHKSKEETAEIVAAKKAKKVVSGNVKTKKNDGRKLASIFISEDATNVKSYVFMDVIVPAVKKLVSDIVTDGVDMLLYGETRGRKNKSSNKVGYRSYYDDRNGDRRDRDRSHSSSRFDYDDLVFDTRGDAEIVRKHMLDTAYEYGMVTVADMYDFAGLSAPFTTAKYGWMGLRDIDIVRGRDGYTLKLPNAMPID